MPLTPSHLGAGFFWGALGPRFFNLWALLLGSVALDLENVVWTIVNVLAQCKGCDHHGFFHSLLGALVGSLILSLVLWCFKKPLERFSHYLSLRQSFVFRVLFLSSFLGWISHVLLDSLVHHDVFFFWPVKENPFLISWTLYWPLSFALSILGILSFIVLALRIIRQNQHD